MSTLGPYHIGPALTINALRSFILDAQLTESDTVVLHPDDFDTLALEHRETYHEALREPYFLLSVLIEPALDHPVPLTRVMALRSDQRPHRVSLALQYGPLTDDGRPIYRCGFCGNFTDANGCPLTGDDLILHTRLFEMRGLPERPQHVEGHCCQHRQYK